MVNLKTQSAKNRYHQQVVRQMMVLERHFADDIATVIKRQFKAAAHEVRQGNRHINSAVERYKFDMLKEFRASYRRIGLTFYGYVNDKLGTAEQHRGKEPRKAAGDFATMETKAEGSWTTEDAYYSSMRFWIDIYAARKVTKVDQTTIDKLKEIIARNMENDLSNDAIADEIEELSEIASRVRAMTIARTETHSVAIMSVDSAIRNSVIGDSLQKKEWMTFEDERTRQEHIDANGKSVGVDESFNVGGEALSFPGDPTGSAWNVINCRCVVEYFTAQEDEEEAA